METNQLTFEHICFKYKGNDNQLFTDLDVTMETGQVVVSWVLLVQGKQL